MSQAIRTRCDSPTKTCTAPGCNNPLRARGFCNNHYKQMRGMAWAYKKTAMPCGWCGQATLKAADNRLTHRFCSWACRDEWQRWNKRPLSCPVPDRHPSRSSPVPPDHPSRLALPKRTPQFFAGYCADCDSGYVIASANVSASRYCSTTCQRRVSRRTRKAREVGAGGSFTWAGFMRLALVLGNTCAYCGRAGDDRLLEPDHVVPLSRGGYNGLTNLLPSCRSCNGDKRDLLVHEWAADRENRGLPHVRYDVERFPHLTAHVHHVE